MTNHVDAQYKALIERVRAEGVDKLDRTSVGTRSVFGAQMRFDISDGKLPLLTTKRVFTRLIIHELLWMLTGDTNIKYLLENNVHIWDSWVDPDTAVYRDLTVEEIQTAIAIEHKTDIVVLYHQISREELLELSEDVGVSAICGLDLSTQPWQDAYRKVFDKEPVTLVSGDCPKVYGKQWRRWEDTRIVPRDEAHFDKWNWGGLTEVGSYKRGSDGKEMSVVHREIDQIANIIDLLRNDPDSRRIILNTWNVGEVNEMALPPCHAFVQFWTRELSVAERQRLAIKKGFLIGDDPQGGVENAILVLDTLNVPRRALSCQLFMRSNDLPLGNPFNLVQYSLLTHMLAHVTGMVADEFIWTGGDCHVYSNQWGKLREQLEREPFDDNGAKLWLNPKVTDIDAFTFDDISIDDYVSHPPVKYPPAAV